MEVHSVSGGISRVKKSVLGPRINLIFQRKQFLYENIKLGEQLLLKTFPISIIPKKVYLVKECPFFEGSASKGLKRYKKNPLRMSIWM